MLDFCFIKANEVFQNIPLQLLLIFGEWEIVIKTSLAHVDEIHPHIVKHSEKGEVRRRQIEHSKGPHFVFFL